MTTIQHFHIPLAKVGLLSQARPTGMIDLVMWAREKIDPRVVNIHIGTNDYPGRDESFTDHPNYSITVSIEVNAKNAKTPSGFGFWKEQKSAGGAGPTLEAAIDATINAIHYRLEEDNLRPMRSIEIVLTADDRRELDAAHAKLKIARETLHNIERDAWSGVMARHGIAFPTEKQSWRSRPSFEDEKRDDQGNETSVFYDPKQTR